MPAPAEIKILIVDDQQVMRSLMRYTLEQIGFVKMEQARSGVEALELLRNDRFNLIICDFNMPEMDGLQLLKEVRSDANLKKTAFIMLSGRADRELVVKAAQAGVNNYVSKPFTVETLKQKIEAVFGALG